jgi:fructuronate reductase
MRYVTGTDEQDRPIDVRDPLAERLRGLADAAGPSADRLAPALLHVREVFGDDLPRSPEFTRPVSSALDALFRKGAKAVVSGLVSQSR